MPDRPLPTASRTVSLSYAHLRQAYGGQAREAAGGATMNAVDLRQAYGGQAREALS